MGRSWRDLGTDDSFFGSDEAGDFFGGIADLFGFPSFSGVSAVFGLGGGGAADVEAAIMESEALMKAMTANAGQEALIQELLIYWEAICEAAKWGGGEDEIISQAETILGSSASAVQDIIAEGAAIVGAAIEEFKEAMEAVAMAAAGGEGGRRGR